MNEETLRDGLKRLEAVDALAKLFSTIWFEKVRGEVQDEKVRAYLTVFEDAFPAMNHVIEYICLSAADLTDGRVEAVQKRFGILVGKITEPDSDTVGVTGQADQSLDAMLDDGDETNTESDDRVDSRASMDTLFEEGGRDDVVDDQKEAVSLANGDKFSIADQGSDGRDIEDEDLLIYADDDLAAAEDLDEDFLGRTEEKEGDDEQGDQEDDLDDFLDADDEVGIEGFDRPEEDDSTGLLDDDVEEGQSNDVDVEVIVEEEEVHQGRGHVAAGISTEEMNALLDDGEGGTASGPKQASRPVHKKKVSAKKNLGAD